MSTNLTGPTIVASNNDIKPSGVVSTPANGSDGTYTWVCVGQKDSGATSTITFSVTGTAASPVISGTAPNKNTVTASCNQKVATTNYVQVTASYGGTSNTQNWTINVGSSTSNVVRFVRGNGGGK
ncbi:MAG: hypothetical protein WAU70_07205 [Flavobacteriales bacterium]